LREYSTYLTSSPNTYIIDSTTEDDPI